MSYWLDKKDDWGKMSEKREVAREYMKNTEEKAREPWVSSEKLWIIGHFERESLTKTDKNRKSNFASLSRGELKAQKREVAIEKGLNAGNLIDPSTEFRDREKREEELRLKECLISVI